MNKCLLIIDPQKDFTTSTGFYALKHKEISLILEVKKNINELIDKINKNYYLIIFYSNYYKNQFGENISMCIPNTVGHELDINKNDNCVYFSKTEHSAFSSLEFKKYLHNNKIGQIYISGFLAEYCVKMTAIDAIRNNFEVVLLKDCIGTGDDVQYQLSNLFDEVKNMGGNVSDFKSVLNN